MHRRWNIVPILIVVSVIAGRTTASAQDGDAAKAELVRLIDDVATSLVKGDTDHVAPLWVDDFSYIHSTGAQQTKPAFLDDVKSGRRTYSSITHGDIAVRLYGDTAVLTGPTEMKLNTAGRDLDLKIRFTAVCVRQGGKWRMAAWQSTPIPDRPAAGARTQ